MMDCAVALFLHYFKYFVPIAASISIFSMRVKVRVVNTDTVAIEIYIGEKYSACKSWKANWVLVKKSCDKTL